MLSAIEKSAVLYSKAKYFVLKSDNVESLELSQAKNVWATTMFPTKRLSEAFYNF